MKSKKVLIVLCMVFSILCFVKVYASTNTYERTEDNLRINSRIKVTSANKYKILKTPSVDASEKVYDFAELLTDAEEETLRSLISVFIKNYDMDMAIVTINDNNKATSEKYADDFYDYNDFGVGSTYDGLLFLIDMDKRKMWISTTGEAIIMYDDARIDKILDYTYEKISNNDYYGTAEEFVDRASYFASLGTPSSNSNYKVDSNGNYVRKSSSDPFPIIPIIIVSGIVTVIFIVVASAKHKTIAKATKASQYLVKDSFNLNDKNDSFLTTHTSKRYSPQSSSSGGGGGSSTHSGSSGVSHGGGGRNF